jgi:hypothetical protein
MVKDAQKLKTSLKIRVRLLIVLIALSRKTKVLHGNAIK